MYNIKKLLEHASVRFCSFYIEIYDNFRLWDGITVISYVMVLQRFIHDVLVNHWLF